MGKTTKLELTWIGKENRPRLEPRILLEDTARSYHAKARVSDEDLFDNYLICGDNLLALKALEQQFTGKVKTVFIDPPYDSGMMAPVLQALPAWLTPVNRVYVEWRGTEAAPVLPPGYRWLKEKSAGQVSYGLLTYSEAVA